MNPGESLLEALRRFFDWLRNLFSPPPGGGTGPEPLQPLSPRVLVVVYDPVVDRATGLKLSQHMRWSRVDDLIAGYIADVDECSGGLVKYRVVERIERDEFPLKIDGFRYDAATYLDVINRRSPAHEPDWADYQRIVADFNLLDRVAGGAIDEVWLFAFPYGGFYESRMAGRGAFECNSPPLRNTDRCPRRFVIMGFSYARDVGEMLEDLGHRAEDILKRVFVRTGGEANLFARFMRYDKIAPGRSEVGTIHFAPNSERDYDWGNRRIVPSRCDDWLNFPNFQNVVRQVNCEAWGNGDIRLHHKWWFTRFPKVEGRTNGISHNWWKYVIDPNNV